MRLILGTNIIISALLKDSAARRIMLDPSFEFYVPEYSIEEIERHTEIITQKSGLSQEIGAVSREVTFADAASSGGLVTCWDHGLLCLRY